MKKSLRIEADWHIHTHYSGCVNAPDQTVQNICDIADQMGLKAIGFSDHLWQNPDRSTWPEDLECVSPEIISGLREEIKAAAIPDGLQVFLGAEAEMIGMDQFSITKEFAESLDFVLLPHNHFQQRYIPLPGERTPEKFIDCLLDRFVSCTKSGLATIMAHPMMPFSYMDLFAPGIMNCPEQKMIDVYGTAAERRIFFELNSDYFLQAREPEKREAVIKIIQCAKRAGCRFTFGSDAHSPNAFSRLLPLIYLAEDAGLLQEDFASIEEVVRGNFKSPAKFG